MGRAGEDYDPNGEKKLSEQVEVGERQNAHRVSRESFGLHSGRAAAYSLAFAERMNIIEIEPPVSPEDIQRLGEVFLSAFHQEPASDFRERVNEKRKLSVLTAESDRMAGFKIGYERHRGVFFSWLGGVLKESRRNGIARDLLRRQHQLCIERGYAEIQTETFGDGKAMLLLNIQEGFEVYGTYLGSDGRLRVQLRKMLVRSNSEQGEGENGEHHGADEPSR